MTDYYCQVHGHYDNGDAWSSGLHVTSNQSPAALLTTFSNGWISLWTDGTVGLQGQYVTTTVIDSFTVKTLNPTMKETAVQTLVSSHAGTSSDNPLPNQDSVVVSLRSPYIQKFGRGRAYLPAPVEGVVVNGTYTSTFCTRVTAAFLLLLNAIRADGSTVFVTNKKPLKDGTPAYQKTVITSHKTAARPARQSRRQDPTPVIYY